MKSTWAGILMMIFATATTASAQTFYINDVVKVTLRSGPGYDHEIVSVLSSGDVVELIQKGDEWSRARIPGGPSGWIVTRLLSEQEPNVLKIRRLEQQLADLQSAGNTDEALREENLRLENALAEARFELAALRQARAASENEAAEDGLDRRSLDEARTRIKTLEALVADCQGRVNDPTPAAQIHWFLAGAAVLLIGLLIGLKVPRRQRSGIL